MSDNHQLPLRPLSVGYCPLPQSAGRCLRLLSVGRYCLPPSAIRIRCPMTSVLRQSVRGEWSIYGVIAR